MPRKKDSARNVDLFEVIEGMLSRTGVGRYDSFEIADCRSWRISTRYFIFACLSSANNGQSARKMHLLGVSILNLKQTKIPMSLCMGKWISDDVDASIALFEPQDSANRRKGPRSTTPARHDL